MKHFPFNFNILKVIGLAKNNFFQEICFSDSQNKIFSPLLLLCIVFTLFIQKTEHALVTATLQTQLQQLLHRAYNIQDHYEQKLLTQVNANVAMDSAVSALKEMDRTYEENRRSNSASLHDDMSSDQDSFVSALDVRFFCNNDISLN